MPTIPTRVMRLTVEPHVSWASMNHEEFVTNADDVWPIVPAWMRRVVLETRVHTTGTAGDDALLAP